MGAARGVGVLEDGGLDGGGEGLAAQVGGAGRELHSSILKDRKIER